MKILGIIINTFAFILILFLCLYIYEEVSENKTRSALVEDALRDDENSITIALEPAKQGDTFIVEDKTLEFNPIDNSVKEVDEEPLYWQEFKEESLESDTNDTSTFVDKFIGEPASMDPNNPRDGDFWYNETEKMFKYISENKKYCFVFSDEYDKLAKQSLTLYQDPKELVEGLLWTNKAEGGVLKRYHNGRVEIFSKIIP